MASPKKRRASRKKDKKEPEPADDSDTQPEAPKKTRRGRAIKKPAAADEETSGPGRLSWTDARTERAISWLEDNPVDRQKLFSDSTQAAKDQGRKKVMGKTPKAHFYAKIAEAVFLVDEDPLVRADWERDPTRYTKSVDNLLTR